MKIINVLLISFFILLVSCGQSDGVAPSASESSNESSNCTSCKVFLSASTDTGSAEVSGFDTLCTVDSNNPNDGSTYKALIGATSRQPPSTDWPLHASTAYVQSDGVTSIGTTTAGSVFTFPVTNPLGTLFVNVRTGLNANMTVSANNCTDWTSASNGVLGTYGVSSLTGSNSISNVTQTCDVAYRVYCVQQ